MKKIFYIATAAIVCSGLLFTSCKKKETEDNDTNGAADHALGETYSNDVLNIGQQASYGQTSFSNSSTYKLGDESNIYATCAVITFFAADTANTDTMQVDFGTGCLGKDGRTRKGILQFVYTAKKQYRDSGNVINVTTPGNTYYVDNNQVIVNSKTITNKGHDLTSGYLTWTITSDIKVNRSNGNTINWTANRTKVLLAGEMPNGQPINWAAAKIATYGTANGSFTKSGGNAESFSVNVSQAKWLVRDFTCVSFRKFFVQGVLEFTPSGKPVREVNFGTGNCDNLAVITINGHTYNVTLH